MNSIKSLGCIILFLGAASLTFAGPGLAYWQQRTQAARSSDGGNALMANGQPMVTHAFCKTCPPCAKKA